MYFFLFYFLPSPFLTETRHYFSQAKFQTIQDKESKNIVQIVTLHESTSKIRFTKLCLFKFEYYYSVIGRNEK